MRGTCIAGLLVWAALTHGGAEEAPMLAVHSPQAGAVLREGACAMVSWSSFLREGSVLVQVSLDGGKTWKDVASRPPEEGLFLLDPKGFPEGVPVGVRLRLRDLQGNALAEREAPGAFVVDRTPPTVRITPTAPAPLLPVSEVLPLPSRENVTTQ